MSHGRLALCSATKIPLALISRAAGSIDTTSRKSSIYEEEMIWKVTLSSALFFFFLQKICARLTSLSVFFFLLSYFHSSFKKEL